MRAKSAPDFSHFFLASSYNRAAEKSPAPAFGGAEAGGGAGAAAAPPRFAEAGAAFGFASVAFFCFFEFFSSSLSLPSPDRIRLVFAPSRGGGPAEPPLLVLPTFPSSVPVFGAPAVLFLGMLGDDEPVLEEAADFFSLSR